MSSVINQRGLNYSIGNGVRAEFGRVTAQLALLEERLKILETKTAQQGPPGPQGPAGQNATVYYSEWFSPTAWSGGSGDWFFAANAPDLTQDIVENGVVLAYVWLDGDLYNGSSVRPLPAKAVGANWGFLIYKYGSIEFTSGG